MLAHLKSPKRPSIINGVQYRNTSLELVSSKVVDEDLGEISTHYFVIHSEDIGDVSTRCVNINLNNVRELMDERPWFVKFYQKNCKKCAKFKHSWEELADRINTRLDWHWMRWYNFGKGQWQGAWTWRNVQSKTHVQIGCVECTGSAGPICDSYMRSAYAHLNAGLLLPLSVCYV